MPVTGRVGTEPSLAGLTALASHHIACSTRPHAQALWPSRGGVRVSAEPVLLAAQMWGQRKTSHRVLEA